MDWYEEAIEEPIRDLVKYLRNSGINTECSCGHDMYIQCQCLVDGQLYGLHNILWNYFSERNLPIDFSIEITHRVVDGKPHSVLNIILKKKHYKDYSQANLTKAKCTCDWNFIHGEWYVEKNESCFVHNNSMNCKTYTCFNERI
jgi:hypothetical protein